MVSKTKKFIYIHINKCAGTSITRFLKSYLHYDSQSKIWPKSHATLQEIYDVMDIDEFNSFYKFATIRNPYDRLKSIYYYGLRVGGMLGTNNFDELVKEPYNQFNMSTFENFILNLPQNKKICESSKETFNTMFLSITDYLSVNGEIKVSRVIPFEYLNHDLKIIQKKLDLTDPNQKELPHLNKRSNKLKNKYSSNYSNKMKKVVKEVYEQDFKNFNFEEVDYE